MSPQQQADFNKAIRNFPIHVGSHILGVLYALLTQFESLMLLVGSFGIISKNQKFKGLAVYLLLWLYYRRG